MRCLPKPSLLVLALATVGSVGGCGGDDLGSRPEPSHCREIEPLSDTVDPGSAPADCSALDGLELFIWGTFEPGEARTGWYINNDRTALMAPMPGTDPIPSTEIPGGRCVGAQSEDPPMVCADFDAGRGACDQVADHASHRAVHIRSGLLSMNGATFARNFPREGCITPQGVIRTLSAPSVPAPQKLGRVRLVKPLRRRSGAATRRSTSVIGTACSSGRGGHPGAPLVYASASQT